ncbi:MAG: alpha/beta hydrolase [Hyphomicrobium sp.]
MKRLTGIALALALLMPVSGLVTGCGQEKSKQEQAAEDNSREMTESAPPEAKEGGSGRKSAARKRYAPGKDVGSAEEEAAPPMTEAAPEAAAPEPEASENASPEVAEEPAPVPAYPNVAAPKPAAPSDNDGIGMSGSGQGGGGADYSRGIGGDDAGSPGSSAGTPPPEATTEAAPTPPPAASDKEMFDVVPVFYGTDRAVEPDPNRLRYGSERGHKLQLGRALVTVPTAHKVPEIERPWVIEIPYFKVKIYEEKEDTAKHFTIQEISALTKEQMLDLVKLRLSKSENFKDHAFVFVHGFNTPFDYALYRTAQIAYDMKFDGAPFVYCWPSGGNVASYTYDRGSAEQAEPYLTEFLEMVIKESGAKSISLIAHSMGNELLLRVLESLRPRTPEGVKISQVILAAPDVDRDKFMNIAREITDFANGVTLYAASNDKALGYSARFWGGVPRAGDVPASGPLIIPGVDTIDVSAVSTDSLGLNHSGYAENNALLNDIKLLLQTGERPPDKRIPILEHMTTAAGGVYWRYPPAK